MREITGRLALRPWPLLLIALVWFQPAENLAAPGAERISPSGVESVTDHEG
ncbi:hypothetical protein ACWGNE_19185 [Streptomyces xiamenensis]